MNLDNIHIGGIIIFILIILSLIFTPGIIWVIKSKRAKKRWLKVRSEYIAITNKKINHSFHSQMVRLWLIQEAEPLYVDNPKGFHKTYTNMVNEIGEMVIKQLTEKYDNEYKSSNKTNSRSL